MGLSMERFGMKNSTLPLSEGLGSLDHVDSLEIDWDRVFRCCPKLLRLDVGRMPLHSTHLGAILTAASTHSPLIQGLRLPAKELQKIAHAKLQPNLQLFYKAMERWYKGGLNRGLLQLTVPHRQSPNDGDEKHWAQYTYEFLNAIAAFCPSLEYLNGGDVTNSWMGGRYSNIRSDEMLFCSLEAWENFCKSCSKLREFNWFYAPLDDRFLEIFSKYPKAQLTKLALATGCETNWEHKWHSGEYLDDSGFKFSGQGLNAMLAACPTLNWASVHSTNTSTRQREARNGFDDDFLVSLAYHCKRLVEVHFEEYEAILWASSNSSVAHWR